jgi:predicted transcriptional regulator
MKFDILRVIALGEEKLTRIMYGSNLSWGSLHRLLPGLVTQGFVEETTVERGKRYQITAKGERALRYYHRAVTEWTVLPLTTE